MKHTNDVLRRWGFAFYDEKEVWKQKALYREQFNNLEKAQEEIIEWKHEQRLMEDLIHAGKGLVMKDPSIIFKRIGGTLVSESFLETDLLKGSVVWYMFQTVSVENRYGRLMFKARKIEPILNAIDEKTKEKIFPGFALKVVFQPEETKRQLKAIMEEEFENARYLIEKSSFKEVMQEELIKALKKDLKGNGNETL